jgi:hypothetical protein
MALESTQPLKEVSTGIFLGDKSLTTLPPSVKRLSRQNLEASTSHKPMGLHGLLQR